MSLLLAATASAWVVTDYKDPITDQIERTASIEYAGLGFHVTCIPEQRGKRAKSYMQITTQRYLGSDGFAEVHYRFDDGKPDFDLWRFQKKSVYREFTDKFVAQMRRARKVTLRIVDYERVPYDLVLTVPEDFSPFDRVYSPCQ